MQEIRLQLPDDLKDNIKHILEELEKLKLNFEPKSPPKYLTKKEVAELFSINLSTVHNWTKKGTLKSVGIGGRRYYLRSDIEKAIVEL